jgi:hypothetical protein
MICLDPLVYSFTPNLDHMVDARLVLLGPFVIGPVHGVFGIMFPDISTDVNEGLSLSSIQD